MKTPSKVLVVRILSNHLQNKHGAATILIPEINIQPSGPIGLLFADKISNHIDISPTNASSHDFGYSQGSCENAVLEGTTAFKEATQERLDVPQLLKYYRDSPKTTFSHNETIINNAQPIAILITSTTANDKDLSKFKKEYGLKTVMRYDNGNLYKNNKPFRPKNIVTSTSQLKTEQQSRDVTQRQQVTPIAFIPPYNNHYDTHVSSTAEPQGFTEDYENGGYPYPKAKVTNQSEISQTIKRSHQCVML
jgi:hypothetical protein